MRASIAIVAAVAGLVTAAPHYGGGYPEYPAAPSSAPTNNPEPYPTPEPSSAPGYGGYPVPSSPAETPVKPSETPEYPEYPVPSMTEEQPAPSKSPEYPEYPEYPVPSKSEEQPQPPKPTGETPSYPSGKPTPPDHESSTDCLTTSTVTVTVPYPGTTEVPHGPYPGTSEVPEVPSPSSVGVPQPPYPIPSKPAESAPYPTGTGAVPPPPAGTASSTGAYVKPTPSSPSEFTGAASTLNVGSFVAGVGAFAAFFL